MMKNMCRESGVLPASPPSPRSEIRSSCSCSRPLYSPTTLSRGDYYLGDGVGTREPCDPSAFQRRHAADRARLSPPRSCRAVERSLSSLNVASEPPLRERGEGKGTSPLLDGENPAPSWERCAGRRWLGSNHLQRQMLLERCPGALEEVEGASSWT